jgi:hypothetical protein
MDKHKPCSSSMQSIPGLGDSKDKRSEVTDCFYGSVTARTFKGRYEGQKDRLEGDEAERGYRPIVESLVGNEVVDLPLVSEFFLCIFFLYWKLNPGPHNCGANILPLESHSQSLCLCFFVFLR